MQDFSETQGGTPVRRLCLVGGSDLQQVSSLCATTRDDFVEAQGSDVGLFINPRDAALARAQGLSFAGYTLEDMQRLDTALAEADQILLSLYGATAAGNVFTFGGQSGPHRYWCTLSPARLRAVMRDERQALAFAKTMVHRRLPLEARLKLTRAALDHAARQKAPGTPLFILGAARGPGSEETCRAFNAMSRAFCAATPGAVFIDTQTLLMPDQIIDSDDYTPEGYEAIAAFLNTHAPDPAPTGQIPAGRGGVTISMPSLPVLETAEAPLTDTDSPETEPESAPAPERLAQVFALDDGQVAVAAGDVSPRWLADLRRSDHRCGFYHSDQRFAAQFTDRDSPVLMISFDNLWDVKDPALSREGWGYGFYRDQGWSHLGVMTFEANWYRDEAVFDYLSNLAAGGFFDAFDRVVLTGTSMGAYAACAFCSLIPGSVVLAFAPQSTLDRDLVPWEERFDEGRAQDWSGRFRDGAAEIAEAGEAYILFDPYFEPDRAHARRLQGAHVRHLKTWFSGHKSALFLRRAGILNPIVRAAVEGTLTEDLFYRLYRNRRTRPWYIHGLADAALGRGHAALVARMGRAVAQGGQPELGQEIVARASPGGQA